MTKVILIHAGPTSWDVEDRISGGHSFPLTDDGRARIAALVAALPAEVSAVFAPAENEACAEVGRMVAKRFGLRLRDVEDLHAVQLGLWEGSRREELRRRFGTSFPQWEKDAPTIMPPDGESSEQAMVRITAALKRMLKKTRGKTIALAMRPMAMQIAAGVLRGETLEALSSHLHNEDPVATIEVGDEVLK
jgi:broad specificity phosphatase PhoE